MHVNKDEAAQLSGIPSVSFDEFPVPSYETWKEEAVKSLKGAPFEKRLLTKTYEGITLEPIYTMEHARKTPRASEYPGQPYCVRGTQAAGYITKPWTIAQAGEGPLPEQANESIRRELDRGGQAIVFRLSEDMVNGRTGGEGPPADGGLYIGTLQDAADTFRDLNIEEHPLHIYAGVSTVPLLGFFAALAHAQGKSGELYGCVGADPIGVLASEGRLPCSLDRLYDEMAKVIHWSRVHAPHLRTILVRGDSYHSGGANAVQELAYGMSAAIAYMEAMGKRGLAANDIAGQIRFSFPLGANFFMEIAKLRAARMLWSRIAEAFGCSEEARKIDLFASTSPFTQSVYDPYVNILRGASQAFSGVVGGADAMQVLPFDGAVGPSDEQSQRIARNIQLMFQNEFDMLQPVDPAGGSWYIETLTQELASEAWKKIQDVDKAGGMVAALGRGIPQKDIDGVLQQRLKNLATRLDRAVGTNMYANTQEKPLERPAQSPEVLREARRRSLESYRANTDEKQCKSRLAGTAGAVNGERGRLVEAVAEAFLAGATLGEVRSSLSGGIAGDMEVVPIRPHRWTEQFEAVRAVTERRIAQTGSGMRVFLANMGPIPQHKARADFTAGFMEVAHFEVLNNDGFATVEAAAEAAVSSGADVAVICSTDETYPELVPPLARQIKAACPSMMVLLAGAPAAEYKDAYVEAGVDDFIHVRCNCLDMLRKIQDAKGMR